MVYAVEDMPQIPLTVRVTPEMHDVLRLYSYVHKVSINETVIQAIRKLFLGQADERFEAGVVQFLDRYEIKIDSTTGGAVTDKTTGRPPGAS
jgi:hypothetical protein